MSARCARVCARVSTSGEVKYRAGRQAGRQPKGCCCWHSGWVSFQEEGGITTMPGEEQDQPGSHGQEGRAQRVKVRHLHG